MMTSTHPTPTLAPNPPATDVPKQTSRRFRDVALLAVIFGFVIAGLVGLAAATGWDETKEQLSKLGWAQVVILMLLSLVNYVFRGLRWHVFARRMGLRTTLWQNLRHFIGGFAMSVTPGRVGELIRMRWLKRETGWAMERTAPLVLMDRASDLAAMAILLGLGVALGARDVAFAPAVAVAALLAAFVATRPALLLSFARTFYRISGVFPRIWARIARAAKSLSAVSSPSAATFGLWLGLVGWLAEGYAFYLLLDWMGAGIGLAQAVTIFTFSTLAGGLTGAPGGVGGAEAAMIALLTLAGVPPEASIPATAVIRITTLWFAILLGLMVFPIAERYSNKGSS